MCKADCLNNLELGESIMWSEKISSKLFSLLGKKKKALHSKTTNTSLLEST